MRDSEITPLAPDGSPFIIGGDVKSQAPAERFVHTGDGLAIGAAVLARTLPTLLTMQHDSTPSVPGVALCGLALHRADILADRLDLRTAENAETRHALVHPQSVVDQRIEGIGIERDR